MRLAAILVLPMTLCPAIHAAKRVTVVQVQQILTAAPGESDAKVAREIADLEATERIDTATLDRWQTNAPGSHTREALLLLADSSAFLALPPSQIPDQPPPDAQSLREMVAKTVDTLGKVLHNLPNFLAMRNTTRFEDSPWRQEIDNASSQDAHQNAHSWDSTNFVVGKPYFLPLSATGQTRAQVTYRDGHEIQTNAANDGPDTGLASRGEFGPILAVVIGDAFHNKVYWDHWEQGPNGLLATFRYIVAAGASHYIVAYPSDGGIKRLLPPYHGEITIDPATGAVRRLTLVADMQAPYQRVQAGLVVEYGPVLLGDVTYICPLRSVNLSREPLAGESEASAPTLRTSLNDVSFTNYHLFHADAHILGTAHVPANEPPQRPH